MRYTQSQAHAQAAREAQALLLQIAPLSLDHAVLNLIPNFSTPFHVSLIPAPPAPSVDPSSSISYMTVPSVPSVIPTVPQAVHSLPIAGLKKKLERNRVALCVQYVTLLNACRGHAEWIKYGTIDKISKLEKEEKRESRRRSGLITSPTPDYRFDSQLLANYRLYITCGYTESCLNSLKRLGRNTLRNDLTVP